ncbi:formate dehydrogenase subunit alpha [Methanosarcina sp. Mfa9]|uniref:formate dehydrogenase subunit alpha n=1 Tax=Methanosarcina sp. Mfa9 TaxID=3439063 RepID=UPI003F84EFC0
MELKYVPTTCPYCGTGCGFNLVVIDGRAAGIEPRQRAPVNSGKLCQKGRYAHEFIHSKDRLVKPLVRKNGQLVEATWEEALNLVAGKFITFHPEEIACLSSAKTSNEDNYLMQKFARVVLKTSNVDHCARLCHSSTVAGLVAVFGSGAMTNSIADLEESKCIFIIGSNTFEQHPLIGRRVMLAKKKGAKIIYADPRFTPTAKQADLYLSMYSGTDVALLNGLMHHIIENGWEDSAFIAKRTKDFEAMKTVVMQEAYSLPNVSKITGVPEEDLKTAAKWIAHSKPSALLYSMGITQHTVGVDNVKSTANLMLLTGNLGIPGGGVNPLRGQNNVQGACDMGCLPDVYPGYGKVSDPEIRRKIESIWGAGELPEKAGVTVTELMEELAEGTSPVRCMYVIGENFMLSDPDLNRIRKAPEHLDFLVVQDIFLTETAKFADVVLPAACYAEKNGTQTSAERRVQRLRKALDPPGEAKADWRIICELAGRMGYRPQFCYLNEAEVFEEIAKVVPQYGGMSYARLENPDSLQWPCPDKSHPGTPILHTEKFATPDGLGEFSAVEWKPPAEVPDAEYPLILTTGRNIWHWHTGTMTRRSETLDSEVRTGWVELHPKDAEKLGVSNREKVRVLSRRGKIEIPVMVTEDIKPGVVFIPFHFKECAANLLTSGALDPVAKIPEYKACAARIEKIEPVEHADLVEPMEGIL